MSLGGGLESGSGGWWGVVFPVENEGGGWGDGVGTGKGTGKSMRARVFVKATL